MCDFNCVAWMNDFPQILQTCFRSKSEKMLLKNFIEKLKLKLPPVCVLKCRFRVSLAENRFLQIPHSYGRSPVCDLRCLVSAPDDGNPLEHKSHLKGFSCKE